MTREMSPYRFPEHPPAVVEAPWYAVLHPLHRHMQRCTLCDGTWYSLSEPRYIEQCATDPMNRGPCIKMHCNRCKGDWYTRTASQEADLVRWRKDHPTPRRRTREQEFLSAVFVGLLVGLSLGLLLGHWLW